MSLSMQKGFLPIPLIIIIGSLILGSSAFFAGKKFDLSKKPSGQEKETSREFDRSINKNDQTQVSPNHLPQTSPNTIIYQTPPDPASPPKPPTSQSVSETRL